ncbi:MAG: flagellar FlbD family protein [Bacillota bacterium]|nr:flagellar FlbD family protein [Bacillota bacterium]
MITLTRLNGTPFMLNIDMVEMMEETPDTIITLTNGKKIVVRECISLIKEKIIYFRRQTLTIRKK